MITTQIAYPWHVATPAVFRFVDQEYVEKFFEDGSLRLSSFAMFASHHDEERLDVHEGETMFVHRTGQRGGQTITVKTHHGQNAYVLCGTTRFSKNLRAAFGSGSYIRINDTTKFGMAVAKQVVGLVAGVEGPCLYQDKKIVERDLGYVDPSRFVDPATRELRENAMERFVFDQMKHLPFFLKASEFAHQTEYRFVWITSADTSDNLHVKVPEAIQFCSRPSEITQ